MVRPKLLTPAPTVATLPGIQAREMNAAPPALPILETEKRRRPSGRRARKVLEIAYPVRFQKPFLPDLWYRLSSWSAEDTPYCNVPRMKCCANALPTRTPYFDGLLPHSMGLPLSCFISAVTAAF